MQEGIIQIGRLAMEGVDFLDSLVSAVPDKKQGKQRYILKFCFSTTEKKVEIDTMEQMSSESCSAYLYIGSAPGANSKQWYATATNNYYHLSETVPNLCEKNFGEEWNQKLAFIKENYYVDLGEEFTSNKNRYAFDMRCIAPEAEDIRLFYDQQTDLSLKDKKAALKAEVTLRFKEWLDSRLTGAKLSDIGLFTIFIDGVPFCQEDVYRKAVIEEKEGTDKVKPKSKKSELGLSGSCYICGRKDQLRDDINVDIKSYTTNLYGFASGTDKKNYGKNMLLCQDCLNAWLAGEKYIKNKLNMRIARFNVYVYPHFILSEPPNRVSLDRLCEQIQKSFNTIVNLENIYEMSKFLDDYKDLLENGYYLLNFMFYRQNQKATKIQRFVQDVHPLRIKQIMGAIEKTDFIFREKFPGIYQKTFINLRSIYYLFPVREDKSGDVMQYRKLLNLYDSILSGEKVSGKYLTDSFFNGRKVLYFEKEGFNIKNDDNNLAMERLCIRQDALIVFLRLLGNIEGGCKMDVESLLVKDEVKDYIQTMQYSEEQAALFLLGCIVGNISIAQYNKTKTKPVMKKINFNGMDKEHINKLAITMQGKYQQEKMYGDCEVFYAEFKRLFDKNYKGWSLDKTENVSYLTSGYSYITMKAISNKKEKEEVQDEQ